MIFLLTVLAADENVRHYHRGRLPKYELSPPSIMLSDGDEEALSQGRALMGPMHHACAVGRHAEAVVAHGGVGVRDETRGTHTYSKNLKGELDALAFGLEKPRLAQACG